MEPEDILLEAMTAAAKLGNTGRLRVTYCQRLHEAMKQVDRTRIMDIKTVRDDGQHAS